MFSTEIQHGLRDDGMCLIFTWNDRLRGIQVQAVVRMPSITTHYAIASIFHMDGDDDYADSGNVHRNL